jgi:predicted nucleotidyltransferase
MMSPVATAERLVQACLAVLKVRVRSVILHGSAATGPFVAGQSDIDLLIVVDDALSTAEIDALEGVVRTADLDSASGVDLDVVLTAVAAAPTAAPPLELHLGRYPQVPLEKMHRVAAAPDLAVELAVARASGRSLIGAEPRDVLGEVAAEWIHERAEHWLAFWQTAVDDAENAQYMVLTACRMWLFSVEERHASKADAGRWALTRDPSLTAVREALHQRLIDSSAQIGRDGVADLLARVRSETVAARDPAVKR